MTSNLGVRSCQSLAFILQRRSPTRLPIKATASLADLMPLEVLHLALVFFRCGARGKRAEITALAGARVLFARIQAEFACFQFANHHAPPWLNGPEVCGAKEGPQRNGFSLK